MGCKPRVEYAGALYYVMCRGSRCEAIFQDDHDRQMFLDTLGEVCERTGWRVCAYVLKPNHNHMVIEKPEVNQIAGMKWFQGAYTKRHNSSSWCLLHFFQQDPFWLNLGRIVQAHTQRPDGLRSRQAYLRSLEHIAGEEKMDSIVGEPRRMHDRSKAARLLREGG